MKKILIPAAIILVIVIVVVVTMFIKKNNEPVTVNFVPSTFGSGSEPVRLYGIFETEEEAQQCADLYGIHVVAVGKHVAVFEADPGTDITALLKKGRENDWPLIEVDRKVYAFDSGEKK